MNEDFAQNYIDDCVKQGKTSLQAISQHAEEEISKIDSELKVIEQLRTRQNAIRAMLKNLGLEEKKQKQISAITNTAAKFEDLDNLIQDMCRKICDYLDLVNSPVTNRQIMNEISSIEENRLVLLSIKWLWEQGIITKNEQSLAREIVKGPNWGKRPNV